jgi:threonine aldolase
MNAMVENEVDLHEYTSQFDSISICLSKGLGAPVGSLLLGNKSFIKKARRVRKVFGGGMRQAGIIAAGGLYALKNNVSLLKTDHLHAKQLEAALNKLDWVENVVPVETNIVVPVLREFEKRDPIINKLDAQGIKIMDFGPGMLRFVTHMDITVEDVDKTITILKELKI